MNKAAQALGRMAAGKPKNYTADEIQRRRERLAEARAKRLANLKRKIVV